MHLRMQPGFILVNPFSLLVPYHPPSALPSLLSLPLFLALSTLLHYLLSSSRSPRRSLSLSSALLLFAPISHPPRRRVHGIPLFSPYLSCAPTGASFSRFLLFSPTHTYFSPVPPSDPPRVSRLVPFRTFTFAEGKPYSLPYPTLRIIPAAVYRTIYIQVCKRRRKRGEGNTVCSCGQPTEVEPTTTALRRRRRSTPLLRRHLALLPLVVVSLHAN